MNETLRSRLTGISWLKYAAWRALRVPKTLRVRLKTGEILSIDSPPSTDLDTAYELFATELYKPVWCSDASEVRTVVDLGGNVGYSALYWARVFPAARIRVYEPHSYHCSRIQRHIAWNRLSDRVQLVSAAAGTASGSAVLLDRGNASTVVEGGLGISVDVRDVFEDLLKGRIDVLKIDIEGAEYAIMDDPRFAEVEASVLVLEWHSSAVPNYGRDWCVNRLQQLGYRTQLSHEFPQFGLIWGYREEKNASEWTSPNDDAEPPQQ